jgi:hypothetical protein
MAHNCCSRQSIDILPVRTSAERRTFLTFPWRIYRDDPLWVPPLLPERAKTIDPGRGAFFKLGQAELFIIRPLLPREWGPKSVSATAPIGYQSRRTGPSKRRFYFQIRIACRPMLVGSLSI